MKYLLIGTLVSIACMLLLMVSIAVAQTPVAKKSCEGTYSVFTGCDK